MSMTRSTRRSTLSGHFGNQHDVGLAVGRAQGEVAGVPAHDLDDGDAAVALGRGADALHAAGRDEHGRGEARRDVVDHLIEVEPAPRRAADVAIAGRLRAWLARPTRRARGGSSGRGRCRWSWGRARSADSSRQGLHAVEGAVAADADEALDLAAAAAGRRRRRASALSSGST